jgi:hypothetical protein
MGGNLMLERGRREEAATRGANACCAKSAYVRACPWVLQGFRVTVYGFTGLRFREVFRNACKCSKYLTAGVSVCRHKRPI